MSDFGLKTLCYLHEIADPGSKSISIEGKELFAVKKRQQVYVYVNRCPHVQLPLNWTPDRFLDKDNELIQCTSHGALFTIDSGLCVAGPCPGRSLESVPVEIINGKISVASSVLAQL
ncbi:Rieske (2Fe-2S) protein [Aurantivibrio plasticivorans]